MLGGNSFDQVKISVQSFNLQQVFPGLYTSIRSVVLASIISKASQELVVLQESESESESKSESESSTFH